jgi:nicotinate-nucleotide adenylyltransferase
LVVGADVVPDLPTWRNEAALQASVELVVVDRPGAVREEPPPGWHAVWVPVPAFDVSSTELRARLEDGRSVNGLVPEAVIRCIRDRFLYATSR